MGQILHAKSRTTEAIRRETKVATRFNVNSKTIIQWRKREVTKDLPMGPKDKIHSASQRLKKQFKISSKTSIGIEKSKLDTP